MLFNIPIRDALDRCDVPTMRRIWKQTAPHLPQPRTDGDTLVAIHLARTQAESVRFKLRAYSHKWLRERGFPSYLPDALKPKAERLHPVIADAVALAVATKSGPKLPLAMAVRGAMEHAVLDAYAEKRTDPAFVKARVVEARDKVLRGA